VTNVFQVKLSLQTYLLMFRSTEEASGFCLVLLRSSVFTSSWCSFLGRHSASATSAINV